MPSPANEQKVQEIISKLQDAEVVVLTDYQGLDVTQITELRRRLREADVEFRVYKNTLLRIAAQSLDIEGLDPYLVGPTAIALSKDPSAPAKVFKDSRSDFEQVTIKSGILGKQVIGPEDVDALVNMPSRDQLYSMVANGLQSPITRLASALNGAAPVGPMAGALQSMISKLANGLRAVAEQQDSPAA